MIVFQLGDGSQYTAQIINYDIEVKKDRLEVYIITDRGTVWYEIKRTDETNKNILFMRDTITMQLNSKNCSIIENAESGRVRFDPEVFEGYRVMSDFFPRPEDKQRP